MNDLFTVCFVGLGAVTVGFGVVYIGYRVLLWWEAI